MNELNGNVNEDYVLPCNFHDINQVHAAEENTLRSQLDLSLDSVSRDDGFNLNSSFSQETSQICSGAVTENEDSLFSSNRDIFTESYRQYVSEDSNRCSTDVVNISSINYSNSLDKDNDDFDDSPKIKDLSINSYENKDIFLNCAESKNFFINAEDMNYCSTNSSDGKAYIEMSKGGGFYFLKSDNNEFEALKNTNNLVFPQISGIYSSRSANSVTKALRNFKRIPRINYCQNFENIVSSNDNNDNPECKTSYNILACTVLVDNSSNNKDPNEDTTHCYGINSSQKDKGPLTSCQVFKKLKKSIYECEECGKQFKMKSHLISHFRAHNNERKFKCFECGLSFKTAINYRFHLETHGENSLNCPFCNKGFKVRKVLSRHIRVVHSQINFECEQCGKKFKTKKNLVHHYGIHSGIRPYSCNICAKTFLHSSSLNTHLREHYSQDCTQCHIRNDINDSLNGQTDISMSKMNSDQVLMEVKPCDCTPRCISDCKRRNTYTPCNHLRKPFTCSTCGKLFKLRSSLVSHMKIHTSTKEYICDECNKTFLKKVSYDIHMKRHRGERPEYMCDQCSQSYYSQFSLKRHYLKHTTQRSFHCQVCNKKFWMKDALLVHMRSHTKEKNFKCDFCSKSFSHKSSLTTHMNNQHKQLSLKKPPIKSAPDILLNSAR